MRSLLLAGCSTTAALYLKDWTNIEGKIERSDESSIYVWVEDESSEEDEVEVAILRRDIRDIDHPGITAATIGTILALVGSAVFGTLYNNMESCSDPDGSGTACFRAHIAFYVVGCPSIVIGVISTILAIWGWNTWGTSRAAAAPPDEPEGPKINPVALTDGERTYYGIGLSWSW
jgi:hypothetical protein